jgi:hypothetical protein
MSSWVFHNLITIIAWKVHVKENNFGAVEEEPEKVWRTLTACETIYLQKVVFVD